MHETHKCNHGGAKRSGGPPTPNQANYVWPAVAKARTLHKTDGLWLPPPKVQGLGPSGDLWGQLVPPEGKPWPALPLLGPRAKRFAWGNNAGSSTAGPNDLEFRLARSRLLTRVLRCTYGASWMSKHA